MLPPAGTGRCWYCAEKATAPIEARRASNTSRGSRSGCNTSSTGRKWKRSGPRRPASGFEDAPGKIVDVQALHHQNDRIRLFVVEARLQRLVEPSVDLGSRRFGLGVAGLDRIINDDD